MSRTCISTSSQTHDLIQEVDRIKERWIKSTDDLMTSQSVEGRDFPDLEMIDAKMASAKKRIKLISTSEEELMSRNRKLKNTTEFLKEGRLPV